MSKSSKVRVLEAMQINRKGESVQEGLVFRVEIKKGEEPITMLYHQLKYTYPDALIDFFEGQIPMFQCEEDRDKEIPEDQDIFDYDSYLSINGCRILQHINSFTLSYRFLSEKNSTQSDCAIEKVYAEEASNFYMNFVLKADLPLEKELKVKKEGSKKVKR